MIKEYDLVMIPTNNKKVFEGQLVFGAGNHLFTSKQSDDIGTLVAQHLYVVSDEEICVGDYFLTDVRNDIYENDGNPLYELKYCTSIFNSWIGVNHCEDMGFNPTWSKKIIATTDRSLMVNNYLDVKRMEDSEYSLPNIFTTFLKVYSDNFNNKNIIKKVTIETESLKTCIKCGAVQMDSYIYCHYPIGGNKCCGGKLKHNIAICQGYVNVRPITNKKDSWNREEVIEEKYELMSLFFTQHYSQLSNIGMTSEYIRNWVKENM